MDLNDFNNKKQNLSDELLSKEPTIVNRLYLPPNQTSTEWLESIVEHNKQARMTRENYKNVVFIDENLLKNIVSLARQYHPNEISVEMNFDGEVSDTTYKLYKPKGFFSKKRKEVLSKIIHYTHGNIISVVSLPTRGESKYAYNVIVDPGFDAQLHTHTLEGDFELSAADIKKSRLLPGPSFLLVNPYTIDDLISWTNEGLGLNVVIVDSDREPIRKTD